MTTQAQPIPVRKEEVVIDVFESGQPVRFRITEATIERKLCFRHGTIARVIPDAGDGPRYDVALTWSDDTIPGVHPSHLMKALES